ncbi:DUF4870 domain-containing protein [Chitinophaga sp. MM2321]|uniref:DUF4870 domain-containing protein n=1 Tax=Chitinophaga sp. MM2321 TaxID=3137178 RepID=UPI0032D5ABBB
MTQKEERTWAAFVHLGGILGMIVLPTAGNIIAVLILWIIKRNESKFVDSQGKEAINFQITISIVSVIVNIINNISMGLWSMANFWRHTRGEIFSFTWGWHDLHGVLWLINIIFCIMAAMKANDGIAYRYPVSLRLVK